MKALLLCAGRGSRLHPYTRNCSKVCLPFLNIPIAAYPLKLLEDLGVSHLLVNTHHQAQQVKSMIKRLSSYPPQNYLDSAKAGPALPASLSALQKPRIQNIIPSFFYEPHLLEGLGTLRKNLSFFQKEEDIIYLNGDSVFLCEDFFPQMYLQHKKKQALMTFLCSPFQKEASCLLADAKGRIVPKGGSTHQACFFAGFVLIHQQCFSLLKKSDDHLFRDFVHRHSQRCFIYMQKDLKFFELGSLSSYMKALQVCVKYLESPVSKEAKLLKKILSRYLSAEFMQSSPHFHLDYLRRQFFTQARVFQIK